MKLPCTVALALFATACAGTGPRPADPTAATTSPGGSAASASAEPALPSLHAIAGGDECTTGVCEIPGLGVFDPRSLVARTEAESPHAVAWLERVFPRATVHFPRREGVDLMGVVVSGRASLALAEDDPTRSQTVASWTAFRLPDGGASIRAAGDEPAVLVLVGTGEPMRARPNIGDETGPRPGAGWTVRSLRDAPDVQWDHGAFHVRYAFEAAESPAASLEILLAGATSPIAEHSHDASWEILVPLQASGHMHLPGAAPGAQDPAVATGRPLFIPPGIRHGFLPDGTQPFVAVQVYTPPGPEQRFRALADGGR